PPLIEGHGEEVNLGSGFAALAVVGDGGTLGVALELVAWSDRGADLFALALQARGAVRHPVDVDQMVVRAAIGLARRDRWRQRDRRVGRCKVVVDFRTAGDDRVIFLVATG